MSTITIHTENSILNIYVPRPSILNKNVLAYELLLRNSLESKHVLAAPLKIIEVLVLTLGLQSLAQVWLVFFSFGHEQLINDDYLSSKQSFQLILTVLTSYLCIRSPSEKNETYSDLHSPVSINDTQTEAILGVLEC